MSEATLTLAEPQHALSLFGVRDRHLRSIRDSLGVSITHRDSQIRIVGDELAVGRATQVLEALKQQHRLALARPLAKERPKHWWRRTA